MATDSKKTKVAGNTNQTYPLQELLKQSQDIFGCNPEVIRGALTGNSKTEFTIDELKKLIDSFKKRRVIS